ncbi:DUF1203 domain-containing protein [Saccharopolyspora sp. ASAGF58]|uniref:DUF1203 domain-containing protein n=1 Tax=Saccharopolyspora sp. ASAGF58 TaxID=2719023 RepID=UPI0014401AAF|nr:DUF1203 domain-containing protein [Saccharopolyspora sp. ASAGF58]QIZ35513.1 DUF1203 domain-containing protein [Saccharopolyspora sp. ASAGF58]
MGSNPATPTQKVALAGVFGQGHFRFSRLVLLYGNTKLSERTAGDLLMAPEVAVVHVRAVEVGCFPVRDASLTPTWGVRNFARNWRSPG